jgi:hypothetical protein
MGALRSALGCVLAFGPVQQTADRVRAPHCLVNGGGITRGTQRRRQPIVHRLGTICGELPKPRLERGREPALEWGSTSMEGTSGAAERVSLRGAAREAALAPVVVAKAASFPDGLASSSGRPVEHRELQTGPAGRPLTAGVWWASRKQVRPVGSSWAHASTCVPGGVGLSSRHRDELHDGRCPSRSGRGEASVASNRDGRRREGRKPAWPLTRETSAGSLRSSG